MHTLTSLDISPTTGCMHIHASTGQVFLCTANNQKDVFLGAVNNQKDVFLCTANNQKDVFCVL